MASLTRAINGSPPPLGPMSRILSEEDAFRQMSPIDQLRAPSPQVGPEQAAANRQQNLRDLLSIVPGPGNVIAAEDSAQAFGDAGRYRAEGKGGKAMGSAALGMLSAFGAVTGLPFGRMAGNAAKGASSTAPAFPAWHGSPHDFDEFKLDKIGTGEGAQAYGHGLYFAENPAVARQYRDDLSNKGYAIDGDQVSDDITAHWADVKRRGDGDLDAQLARYTDDAEYWRKTADERMAKGESRAMAMERHFSAQQNADALKRVINGDVVSITPGRLYKAEIDAEPHQLLDWDKPLSQQNEAIRAFADSVDSPIVRAWKKSGTFDRHTGADLYRVLGDQAETSAALRGAGIPGIQYADQFSRFGDKVGKDQTRNYVIFDDKLTKVLGKE